jgi:aryl-alcohol dehydrogenase-like predicted oxidoreductase
MMNSIPRRRLGSDLEVSAIGLGCMGMSDFYGPSDETTNLAVLNRAVDLGIDFLDTADMYGRGANERLLAQVLAQRRNDMVIATKFGNMRSETGEFLGVNGRPEYVLAACDASLSRLGVEHIDLYYQHRVDPNVAIEETVGAMAQLVSAGKVRHLGLSEAAGDTVRRAARVHPITALQTEYSLWTCDVEQDSLRVCRELGVGFVAYSPLGRGFLTGAIQGTDGLAPDDSRRRQPRFAKDNAEHNRRLVEAVAAIAREHGCTPAQLALAWLLHQGEDIVPIPGTRRIQRLEENAAATRLSLSASELERIAAVLKEHVVAGTRYPAPQMSSLNR